MVLKKFIKIISVTLVSLVIINFSLNAKVRDNDAYFSKQEGIKIIDELKDLGKTDYDYEHFYYYYPGELMWYVQKCLKNENNEINYAWKNLDQITKLITYELGSKILNYKNQAVNTVICNSYGNPNLQSELEQSISGIFEILKNIYGDTELQNTQKHILNKLKDSEVISNPNELIFYKKFIEDALNDSLGPIINLYNKDFSKVIVTIPASKFAQLKIVGDDEYSYLTKFGTIGGKIRKEEINNLNEYEFINEYVIQKQKVKLIKKKEEDKEPEKLEQKIESFDVLAELSKNDLILLQENLKLLEFYQGSIDGIFGQNTLNALKKWIKSKEYEEIFKEKYVEDISREANLKKDNLITLSKNAAEKLSISSLSDNDLVFLLKKSSNNFTRDLEGNFIYLGADKIKVCQLQEVSNDDFLKFSTDNFKQQFLKSTNNVKCDRNINDSEVILFQKNNFINLSSNIYFELSENYEVLYLSLFEKFQKELDDKEKKKNEIIQKRKETISEIIKGIKDKNLVDYAFIKVEPGNICIDQEIEIENSISLKEFLINNDQYLPDDFQSEILFMTLNDVFIGLKTAQCGYVLSNAKNLKLILDGLIRDDLNYQFVPIIIKKTDIKDSNIKEQSDDNKNNQKDVINSSNSISENFIPKENNKTVEPENILKNKKLILKSDLMLVSSNDESCPDIITFSFFNNSTFELYYDTCNPKGNLLTLTGNYETYSDSNNQIKVTTSYAFDGKDYEDYLIFNFQDKIELASLESVFVYWGGNWDSYREYFLSESGEIESRKNQSNSEKIEVNKNNAITFLKINQSMSNLKKAKILQAEGYDCAEILGSFACGKGNNQIQIHEKRVQFNCNSFNGCSYKQSEVISNLSENLGIDIYQTEIISTGSGTYTATCGDGPDGDRICVLENNGTDVWLYKGSLGASKMKF